MKFIHSISIALSLLFAISIAPLEAQMPTRYATLELFTNTPCPICGSQNPGLFDRLEDYEGQYHLISFYPGKPYSTCIFYQANTSENTTRFNHYPGIAGTPTVAINGQQLLNSGSVTTSVLDNITGGESWLSVEVDETAGTTRDVTIDLEDHAGGSLGMGKLYAVIVEREIMYNAPNGETVHHNVFREFLTDANGDDVDMSPGTASRSFQYTVDSEWQASEVYVIAWLMDPDTDEIFNSGTRFDNVSTGIENTDISSLNIFPNPVSAFINIDIPEDGHTSTLKFFDAAGKIIYLESTGLSGSTKINCQEWPTGTYQVRLEGQTGLYTGKFQVVR